MGSHPHSTTTLQTVLSAAVVVPCLPAGADRHPGANGWLSCWGTVGEVAGCPPTAPPA